ncbi:MAG TPA: hypothetical protein VFJ17_00580 [Mycobacteriales bacterium]|jgi:hypothetical protein|nr:hypothetical protein [Mycobacteriales bacterium]
MTIPQDVEALLRDALAEQAAALRPQIQTQKQLRVLTARFPAERRRWRTHVTVVVVAAVAAVAAVSVGLVQLAPVASDRSRNVPAGPIILPTPAPVIGETWMPPVEVSETVERFTAPAPDLVIGGTLWVDDRHEGTITRYDTRDLSVIGVRRYATTSSSTVGSLTLANGIVLLTVDATAAGGRAVIRRFDAASGKQLAPIHVQRAGAVVSTPVGVIAQVGDGKVGIVDATAGTVVRTFRLPVNRHLAYADGLVWGWDDATSTLVGADPLSGDQERVVQLPGFSDLLMEPDGHALVLAESTGLARFDTRTGNVTAATSLVPLNLSRDRAGRLWGVVPGRALYAFDPTSLRVLRAYRMSGLGLVQVAGKLLIASDSVTGQIRSFALGPLISR